MLGTSSLVAGAPRDKLFQAMFQFSGAGGDFAELHEDAGGTHTHVAVAELCCIGGRDSLRVSCRISPVAQLAQDRRKRSREPLAVVEQALEGLIESLLVRQQMGE